MVEILLGEIKVDAKIYGNFGNCTKIAGLKMDPEWDIPLLVCQRRFLTHFLGDQMQNLW